jgi:hypothetical protein
MLSLFDWKEELKNTMTTHDAEPCVNFLIEDGVNVMSIKSSGIVFHRDSFPNDSYEQAAKRVYNIIKPASALLVQPELNWTLSAWREFPQRTFRVTKDGIEHNYELDTWHTWFMMKLNELIRRMPS